MPHCERMIMKPTITTAILNDLMMISVNSSANSVSDLWVILESIASRSVDKGTRILYAAQNKTKAINVFTTVKKKAETPGESSNHWVKKKMPRTIGMNFSGPFSASKNSHPLPFLYDR